MTNTQDEVTRLFESFTATIVSDALDEHGIDGVITGVDPAHPDHATVGRARPVRFEPAPEDVTRTNFPFDLFAAFDAGDVFVLDGISPEVSCWGELASRLAGKAGVRGTVIDGGYRDYNGIRDGDYPVFGVETTPRSGQPRVRIDSIGEPVTIRGVTVAPDDVVVADGTGIAVVPEDAASDVAETAKELLGKELVLDRRVENGADAETLIEEYGGF